MFLVLCRAFVVSTEIRRKLFDAPSIIGETCFHCLASTHCPVRPAKVTKINHNAYIAHEALKKMAARIIRSAKNHEHTIVHYYPVRFLRGPLTESEISATQKLFAEVWAADNAKLQHHVAEVSYI